MFLKEEYRETTKSMSFLKANIVALLYPLPFVVLYIVLFALSESVRRKSEGTISSGNLLELLLWLLFYFAAFFGLIVLHEFIHALFFLKGCD